VEGLFFFLTWRWKVEVRGNGEGPSSVGPTRPCPWAGRDLNFFSPTAGPGLGFPQNRENPGRRPDGLFSDGTGLGGPSP
jgi:hypothetical protein